METACKVKNVAKLQTIMQTIVSLTQFEYLSTDRHSLAEKEFTHSHIVPKLNYFSFLANCFLWEHKKVCFCYMSRSFQYNECECELGLS